MCKSMGADRALRPEGPEKPVVDSRMLSSQWIRDFMNTRNWVPGHDSLGPLQARNSPLVTWSTKDAWATHVLWAGKLSSKVLGDRTVWVSDFLDSGVSSDAQ